jgi:prevent-host-death family protein
VKKVSVSDLKNQLSVYIDRVQRGRPLLIVGRGRHVARLEPISGAGAGPKADARLLSLERERVLRRGQHTLPAACLEGPLPRRSHHASAVEALRAEREDGR